MTLSLYNYSPLNFSISYLSLSIEGVTLAFPFIEVWTVFLEYVMSVCSYSFSPASLQVFFLTLFICLAWIVWCFPYNYLLVNISGKVFSSKFSLCVSLSVHNLSFLDSFDKPCLKLLSLRIPWDSHSVSDCFLSLFDVGKSGWYSDRAADLINSLSISLFLQ